MRSKPPTFAVWSKEFGAVLQRIDPSYQLNKEVKGIKTEFLRSHASGLLISQNCIRMRIGFHHSFAVLLSQRLSKVPDGIRNRAIILNNYPDFIAVREELQRIVESLSKL